MSRLDNVVGIIQRPELKGHIALGIPDSYNTIRKQAAVARCVALNKGLKVQVTAGLSADLAEQLEQGQLDVVILQQHCNYARPYHPPYQQLLLEESLYWVTGNWNDFRELEELPLITFFRRVHLLPACYSGNFGPGGACCPYYLSFVSGSYENIRSAIFSGFGVGVLPESEIGEKYTVLEAEEGFPELPNVYVILQTKTDIRVIRQFCDLLKDLPDCNPKQRLDL